MGLRKRFVLLAAMAASMPGLLLAQGRKSAAAAPQSQQSPAMNDAINRIVARERTEVATIRRYTPLIETYIQEMRPDDVVGTTPFRDHYFIGQANLAKGIVDNSLISKRRTMKETFNPIGRVDDLFSPGWVPEGFLQMIYIDTKGFNRQEYRFDYIRREFLGEVRCLVFDVVPISKDRKAHGRFKGRIWAEDQNYTIVRFNGIYADTAGMTDRAIHFDSWRVNSLPNVWLPSYIFTQQTDPYGANGTHTKFRAQTRLWGYNMKNAGRETDFTEMKVETAGVQDTATGSSDPGPIEAEREWQEQAENNVLERLQRSGLVAPHNDMDKVMEAVVNNIEVGNNLDIEPEVHCRTLLTSTLESFTIGHTIVLSRGLLDTLPDEASLAVMLAQDLADLMKLKNDTDRWGFNDETIVPTVEAMRHFSFNESQADLEDANKRAVVFLKNSIYKDKLQSAGLFMKQLDESSKSLTALISPRLGHSVPLGISPIQNSAPKIQPTKLDQIAALPLGARLKLDPYSDRIELLKAKPVALLSAREKMPFEVTPFMPYLTRYAPPTEAAPPPPTTPAASTPANPNPTSSTAPSTPAGDPPPAAPNAATGSTDPAPQTAAPAAPPKDNDVANQTQPQQQSQPQQ
jgi:hypothetical protein